MVKNKGSVCSPLLTKTMEDKNTQYTLLYKPDVPDAEYFYYVRNNSTGKLYGYDVKKHALEHIRRYTAMTENSNDKLY